MKKGSAMDENTLLGQLEELARSLAIEVRYEPLKSEAGFATGGLCTLRGKHLVIIHSKAPLRDKIQALATAVTRFDLSQVYVRPGLREFLERIPRPRVPSASEQE